MLRVITMERTTTPAAPGPNANCYLAGAEPRVLQFLDFPPGIALRIYGHGLKVFQNDIHGFFFFFV